MNLRKFNNLLSIIVIALGLYIALSPILPEISYRLRDKSAESSAPYSGKLANYIGSTSDAQAPQENRLVIPSIQVDEPILEGGTIGVISKGGTWRRPNTASPLEQDNTVIVGHRYFGNNVSTFYHLNKVLTGQRLAVYWRGQEILYEVVDVKIVDSTAVEIEAPTQDQQLTIYTCDPIWTAKNRLVVIAKPIS